MDRECSNAGRGGKIKDCLPVQSVARQNLCRCTHMQRTGHDAVTGNRLGQCKPSGNCRHVKRGTTRNHHLGDNSQVGRRDKTNACGRAQSNCPRFNIHKADMGVCRAVERQGSIASFHDLYANIRSRAGHVAIHSDVAVTREYIATIAVGADVQIVGNGQGATVRPYIVGARPPPDRIVPVSVLFPLTLRIAGYCGSSHGHR